MEARRVRPRVIGGVLLALALVLGSALVAAQEVPPESPESTDVAENTLATLSGQVLIGPTWPVASADQPDRGQGQPYAATLAIRTADGASEVTQITTDDQGNFSVELAPDTYKIVPLTPRGTILPRGIPLTVTLTPGASSSVVIHYDSGIR